MKKQMAALAVLAWPIGALAQDTGVQVVQHGAALAVSQGEAEGIMARQVQPAAAPFALTFPAFDCTDIPETVWMRFVPTDLLPEVARIVQQASALPEGEARNDVLYPYGSSMAVPPGVMDRMIMTLAPHRGYAWEFMYVEGDGFARQGPDGATVTIDVVYETWEGLDVLAEGIPFVMMLGRPRCDQGAPRMALDVFEVSFGTG